MVFVLSCVFEFWLGLGEFWLISFSPKVIGEVGIQNHARVQPLSSSEAQGSVISGDVRL